MKKDDTPDQRPFTGYFPEDFEQYYVSPKGENIYIGRVVADTNESDEMTFSVFDAQDKLVANDLINPKIAIEMLNDMTKELQLQKIIRAFKKTNPMTNTNDKPKYTRPIPSEIEYHEKAQWKKDENIITIMGGLPNEPKRPLATIKLLDYDENKKPILAVLDLAGNEIAERSSNLYELKKYCRDNEQRLTKDMLIANGIEQKEETQEQQVHENNPPDANAKRTNELKKTRRTRNTNEQSQEISH